MFHRGRWRGRGGRRSSLPLSASQGDDGKGGGESVTRPPPTYPVNDHQLPPLPEITEETARILDRWHKLRHFYRSGPFFIEESGGTYSKSHDSDPFAVRRYSDMYVEKHQKPPLAALMVLSSTYVPEELTTRKDRRFSSHFASAASETADVFWLQRLRKDKDIDRFEEFAKRTQEEKRAESDTEGHDLQQEQGDDEFSGNDYQQGEYFDDDEEYDNYDDGGDDGPVF